ncbi:MAG TPA: polysaccharide pyruvyl transferase family protein [Mycobacteriales bacterium]|nr:polysaccharide pyruvyl transferase family protein [Mycobacteriales bacterium]
MPTVATLGAAFSANKGAAAMMQSLLDDLPGRVPGARVVVVSTHPADDRMAYERAGIDVAVVSQQPVEMALVQVPLALVAGLLRVLHLPFRWLLRPPALRALSDADLVADLSGISFVDGRRFVVLVYNALVVWVPMLLGARVVKCSQAMGPFATPVNSGLARLTLPRLARVCPRGAVTEAHLRGLGLTNLTPAADMAFAMQVPEAVRTGIGARLAEVGPYVAVSPSQVVATYCEGEGIDYAGLVAELVDRLAQEGHRVVMLAHSAQQDRGANHMNDLPLCRAVAGRVTRPDHLLLLDEDLLPTQLRAVIAGAEVLVTSRFHAMIAALAERVPPVVVGWSHKYAEVLEPFHLASAAISYEELTSVDVVLERTLAALRDRQSVAVAIGKALPAVQAQALVSFEVLAEELAR